MKNKDFDSFNNDRINALRKRIDELIYLKIVGKIKQNKNKNHEKN